MFLFLRNKGLVSVFCRGTEHQTTFNKTKQNTKQCLPL
jgi:hypothetical protein